MVIWDCNRSPDQTWVIEPDGTIRHDGRCLDVYRDEMKNNAPVELYTCTGGANQRWQPVHGTLVNPVSRKCLDDPRFNTANGPQLVIYTCNGDCLNGRRAPVQAHGTGPAAGCGRQGRISGGALTREQCGSCRRP